jgi:predicted RNA-binding protein with RPS1 domain
MPKRINFKLSDDEKFNALWALLNPEFNEEGNWTVSYGISAVYDEYALCVNYESGEMNRVYYSKNDEKDMVELGEIVKCYVVDVTENEKATLDTLRVLNGDTYELVSEVLEQAESNADKVSEFSTKIEELEQSVATLTTERDNANSQATEYSNSLTQANETITSLQEENASLTEYKN